MSGSGASGSGGPPKVYSSSSLYAGIFNSSDAASPQASSSHADPGSTTGAAAGVATSSSNQVSAAAASTWSASLRFAPRAKAKGAIGTGAAAKRTASTGTLGSSTSTTTLARAAAFEAADEEDVPVAGPRDVHAAYSAHASAGLSSVAAKNLNRAATGPSSFNYHEEQPQSSASTSATPSFTATTTTGANEALPRIGSKLRPILREAPPATLSNAELRRERELVEREAEARGEGRRGSTQQRDAWGAEDRGGYDEEEGEEGDVNGFWSSEAGRRSKKKKSKRRRSPGVSAVDMDADYDVRVPNNYSDYIALRQTRRQNARRHAQYMRGDEVDEVEDDEEERERRNKFARFAPPPGLYGASSAAAIAPGYIPAPAPQGVDDDEKPYLSITPPPELQPVAAASASAEPPTRALTGDEAYARRVALSQGLAAPALSAAPPVSAPPGPPPPPPAFVSAAVSGAPGPPPPPPSFVPASSSSASPPPPAASISALPADFAARQSVAAAIAARLAASMPTSAAAAVKKPISWINPSSASASSNVTAAPEARDQRGFAARMMAAQGWKVGEGIGAEGNKGMVVPLMAKKSGGEESRGNRGSIVGGKELDQKKLDRERFGEPSQVILLENMVVASEMDDDLPGDVGDECSKHGFVERVAIWPSTTSAEEVRIFVRFTGHAGAWRCVQQLDGRFFGGRVVRARYYPESAFTRGEYELP